MDLIERLKEIMQQKGFSCETMAKFIGCSGKTVDRWINGESRPSFVYQQMIKKAIKKVEKF